MRASTSAWAALTLLIGCGGGHASSGETIENEPAPNEQGTTMAEAAPPSSSEPARLTAPELTVGDDVTPRFRAANAATSARPHTTFRRIEAHRRDAPRSRVTASGFTVQFPSHAPVQTPTAHRGVLVVAGGFHSRQMYAYREATGEPLWGLELGDDGPSNAACEDGVCVFSTESCTLFAVDVESGRLLWSHYLGDPLMSAPTIADGRVFAAYPAQPIAQAGDARRPEGMSHALGAFDLRTGDVRWARWLDSDVISAPVAIVGSVYVSTFAGTMIRFDAVTGVVVTARDAEATSAPTWIEDALVFARRQVDTETPAAEPGAPVAPRTTESLARSSTGSAWRGSPRATSSTSRAARYLEPEFQNGTEYAAQSAALDTMNGFGGGAPSSANSTIALSRIGRGSVRGLQEYQGSWVLGVGEMNVASMGDEVVSFDRISGEERWTHDLPGELARTGGSLAAPPVLAGDNVLVATQAGQLRLLDPDTGAERRHFDVGASVRTQPIASDGWIYVGTAEGQLVGIRTGDPRITGWTTWAGNAQRTGRPTR